MIEFGTGGFRGIIASDFTEHTVRMIAQGLCEVIKEKKSNKPVCVGYDYRFMSDFAATWICEVLAGNGIKCILSSTPTPTPVIMQASKDMDNDFGVMITASHNPYCYNGVKLFQGEGMDAEASLTSKIEKRINSPLRVKGIKIEEAIKNNLVIKRNLLEGYMDNIFKHLNGKCNPSLRVLVDPIYGTGSITLKMLVERMGLKNVVFINDTHDALFGGKLPNPTKENMLEDSSYVLKEHFDLAIGTDSDCDRLGILDELGQYVDANEILAALYYYLVKYRGMSGDIVKNIATSDLLDLTADYLGFKCHQVDVGFKNISAGIKEYDCLIGGESSGGLTIRNYIFGKDSTFACALFLEMISVINKPVSQIIREIKAMIGYDSYIHEDSKVFTDKKLILDYLKNHSPKFTASIQRVEVLGNNYKYYFNDGWALIRFSGTEPIMRIFVELKNKKDAVKNAKAILDFVDQIELVHA